MAISLRSFRPERNGIETVHRQVKKALRSTRLERSSYATLARCRDRKGKCVHDPRKHIIMTIKSKIKGKFELNRKCVIVVFMKCLISPFMYLDN